jgi:hypothetical protein
MDEEFRDSKSGSLPNKIQSKTQTAREQTQNYDSVELALRFLIGLLALGGEEAARRLEELQQKLDADPARLNNGVSAEDDSISRQAWHLGVGLFLRGQRRLRKELRRGLALTLGVADQVVSESTQRGRIMIPNPIRDALEVRLVQWRNQAIELIKMGELEEQKGRALAKSALTELISEIMDEIAENPELQEFVQDLVGQQGVGMATSVVDNARSVAFTADDAVEGLLRWLIRRTPRRDLPPSPVEGQAQTMYAPKVKIEGRTSDDE